MKSFFIPLLFFCALQAQALTIGDNAPSCPAQHLSDGKPLTMDDYQGKVILVDFWATWCPPCKKSMPFLNQLRHELAERGFEIVAINVDENSSDAADFLRRFPVDYPVYMDPDGKCPGLYDVKAMPSSYFVDRNGIVQDIHFGFRSGDEAKIRQRIESLLQQ